MSYAEVDNAKEPFYFSGLYATSLTVFCLLAKSAFVSLFSGF